MCQVMALPPMLSAGSSSVLDRFLDVSPPRFSAIDADPTLASDVFSSQISLESMARAASSPSLSSGLHETPSRRASRARGQRQGLVSQSSLPRLPSPSPDIAQDNSSTSEVASAANIIPSAIIAAGAGGSSSSTSSGQGNIRVAVRVRPLPAGDQGIIEVIGKGTIAIRKEAATGGNEYLTSQRGRTEERIFDRVFGPVATQLEVYEWCCRPLINAAVDEGKNATVFVYGATGAGKTHTMFGEEDETHRGLISRAVNDVFAGIAKRPSSEPALIAKASFLELYNEKLYDLLYDGTGLAGGLCNILEDERRGILKILNLSEVPVGTADEALQRLSEGLQLRKVESTAANARSSRSHAVFVLQLEYAESPPDQGGAKQFGDNSRLHSKISLIDLAGSERASQTQNNGAALRDGAKINQSLLALANCINALGDSSRASDNKDTPSGLKTPQRKPPYRDSKLTLLLKSSLVSEGLVSMIANVHPGRDHFEDSNNTLEYAKRTSTVKAQMVVRREPLREAAPMPVRKAPQAATPPRSPFLDHDLGGRGAYQGPSQRAKAAVKRPLSAPKYYSERPHSGGTSERADMGTPSSNSRMPSRAPVRRSSGTRQTLDSRRSSSATPTPSCLRRSGLAEADDQDSTSNAQVLSAGCPETNLDQRFAVPSKVESVSESMPLVGIGRVGANAHSTPCTSRFITPCASPSMSSRPDLEAMATPQRARLPSGAMGLTPPDSRSPSLRAPPARERSLSTPKKLNVAPTSDPSVVADRPAPASSIFSSEDAISAVGPSREMLLRIVESLQAEKAAMDLRLRAVTSDRDRLEVECTHLRAANLEKDRQLALLLVGQDPASLS